MNQNQALPAGTRLQGHSYAYEIESVLGQGSFGITYRARLCLSGELGELSSNVTVAVKEFFMKDINGREGTSVTSGSNTGVYSDYKAKFKREAVNLSRMKHPGIVKVLEAFEANNTFYYAMEYIEGGSLDNYIGEWGGLPEREALDYLERIGSALAFMHDNRMLHLDLKPLNVMRRADGQPVLIDFGLSKQYGSDGQPESSTTIGGGTPGYAPLEQANYHEGRDFPVTLDVYALGATLYKMLTGQTPPVAADVLNDGFPEEPLLRKQVSRKTIEALRKAMSPMKKERWQTVGEFLGELGCEPASAGEGTVVREKIKVVLEKPREPEPPLQDPPRSFFVQEAFKASPWKNYVPLVRVLLCAAIFANVVCVVILLIGGFVVRGLGIHLVEMLPLFVCLFGCYQLCKGQYAGFWGVLAAAVLAIFYLAFFYSRRWGPNLTLCFVLPTAVLLLPSFFLRKEGVSMFTLLKSNNISESRKLLGGVIGAAICLMIAVPGYYIRKFEVKNAGKWAEVVNMANAANGDYFNSVWNARALYWSYSGKKYWDDMVYKNSAKATYWKNRFFELGGKEEDLKY